MGLGTDGYLLSREIAGSGNDRCGNPAGLGVKHTRGPMALQVAAIGLLTAPLSIS